MGDLAAVGAELPALRELTMVFCVLPLDALAELVCSFTGLESFSLVDNNGVQSVNTSVVGCLKALHTLELDYTGSDLTTDEEPDLLVGWLTSTLQPHQLQMLHISLTYDPGPIQPLFDTFGPHGLKHLRLDLYDLQETARDTTFTLEPCTNLRTVFIELGAGSQSPEASMGLMWPSVLISQLSSLSLETITLLVSAPSFWPWDVDIVWRFDDLQALDWRSINRTLGRLFFNNLRAFNIHGRGPRESLEACLQERCGTAYTRGLFRLLEE
ncbi:uncharacterized protein B0H18DRAFT_1042646 [Fomitopsis serialis]|uniref:uncharacterized protein n=1 Tax=Fomitopsis serialis TaxID=139415 RepID=UPI00200854C2|nr:uncharacterized protein B0H18DRAFT_1042646 [Neoantrodia serialis]KAH9915124.1 hypothetical protein B0H18DRAFT_1042646 [Neoantrodia serialis]